MQLILKALGCLLTERELISFFKIPGETVSSYPPSFHKLVLTNEGREGLEPAPLCEAPQAFGWVNEQLQRKTEDIRNDLKNLNTQQRGWLLLHTEKEDKLLCKANRSTGKN